jgi:uncharacterized protein YcbK (DUF882 family)
VPVRRFLSVFVPPALVGAAASLGVAGRTAADPPVAARTGIAVRKEPRALASEEAGVVETLGTLFNVHTDEAMPLSRDEPTQERFSDALSDRVTGSRIGLDPRLLDLLRRIAAKNPGVRIELVSGFRSPKLNEMLRKKGHHVASHSQHSLGHAVDFRLIGLTPAEMKQEVLKQGWEGGIGQYDKESDNFVHADVGAKRYWYEGRGQ